MSFLGLFDDNLGKFIFLVKRNLYEDFGSLDPSSFKEEDIIILSATEEFSRTDTTTVTEYPISSGGRHTDHYNVNPSTVSFRGVISPKLLTAFAAIGGVIDNGINNNPLNDLKTPVTNYLKRVREVMLESVKGSGSPLFTAYLPDNNSIENCVITSFSISRDSLVSDGYYVDITVQEVFFATTDYAVVPKNDTVAVAASKNTSTGNEYTEDKINPGIANQSELPGVRFRLPITSN